MEQTELKGRHSAGNSFLRGLVRHTAFPDVVATSLTGEQDTAWRRALGPDATAKPVRWLPAGDVKALSQTGCVYVPGPFTDSFLNMRMFAHPRAFSCCGVTHTTASCLDMFASFAVKPLFSWDALICTSMAVRDTLRTVYEDMSAYLSWRFGAGRLSLPQMPLIPLGVVADDYAYSDDDRAAGRAALGLAADETAVLFLGRLSFHAKANPASMYLALEEVARQTGRKLAIILCGWFINKGQEEAFCGGAAVLAPSVRLIVLDGREADKRKIAWSSADIFCSLSDNIQETFGLTPLEAMAAGLPVVVSDWDGYRDTVRHGVDGFRIPTMTPAPPLGARMAFRFASGLINYDHYLAQASQVTSVDLDECVKAIRSLAESPELRAKMGAAGRARARELFDWRYIIRQYEELWAELAERRRADADPAVAAFPRNLPGYPDPFRAFATYASELLTDGHIVRLRADNPVAALGTRAGHILFNQGAALGLDAAPLRDMLAYLRKHGSVTVAALAARFPPQQSGLVKLSVLWCAKMGLVRVERPQDKTDAAKE